MMSKKDKLKHLDSMSKEELEEMNEKAFRDSIVGYTLMNCAELFLQRSRDIVERRSKHLFYKEKKKATRQLELVQAAINEFDYNANEIDDIFFQQDKAFMEEEIKNGKTDAKLVNTYDKIRRNANELARLVQLYYNTCSEPENAQKVNNLMWSMESKHIFSDDEVCIRMKENTP